MFQRPVKKTSAPTNSPVQAAEQPVVQQPLQPITLPPSAVAPSPTNIRAASPYSLFVQSTFSQSLLQSVSSLPGPSQLSRALSDDLLARNLATKDAIEAESDMSDYESLSDFELDEFDQEDVDALEADEAKYAPVPGNGELDESAFLDIPTPAPRMGGRG